MEVLLVGSKLIYRDLVNDQRVQERNFGCLLYFLKHLLILVLWHAERNLLYCLIVWNTTRLCWCLRWLSHDLGCHLLRLGSVLSDI